jgi:nicotinamidase/pyrazinamidase
MAFFEADHKTPTGLAGYLKERAIDKAFVAGLATDFCVAWTAIRLPIGRHVRSCWRKLT